MSSAARHANPRVGHRLVDALPTLLEHAQHLPDAAFKCSVRRWEALADVDGAHQGHDAADANRSAHAVIVGDRFHLDATAGVIAGTSIVEILRHFEQAQFDAEWDDLRARYGEGACPAMLERTAPQRRFDALCAVFERAAGTAPGTRQPEPVVNIVVDQATWEAWVARLSGEQPDAPLPDAADVDARRCETVDGAPVDPADAVIAGIVGHVRRVVMDSSGVVIDLGRKRRMYTGSAREAAVLQGRRCWWPGCGQPSSHIDHSTDWARDGHTNPANAAPACPRHNRYKNRGYLTWRDRRGRWHTHRPDGTEIVAA